MVRETLANDITYIWTREGWSYLSVIIDLYSRRVIGWAISNRMKQDLALRALDMATALRRPPPGCIHHTDRGAQYCAHAYQKRLRRHKLLPSMSGKGNCYDNSAPSRQICAANRLPGNGRELLQISQGRADLAKHLANATGRRHTCQTHT